MSWSLEVVYDRCVVLCMTPPPTHPLHNTLECARVEHPPPCLVAMASDDEGWSSCEGDGAWSEGSSAASAGAAQCSAAGEVDSWTSTSDLPDIEAPPGHAAQTDNLLGPSLRAGQPPRLYSSHEAREALREAREAKVAQEASHPVERARARRKELVAEMHVARQRERLGIVGKRGPIASAVELRGNKLPLLDGLRKDFVLATMMAPKTLRPHSKANRSAEKVSSHLWRGERNLGSVGAEAKEAGVPRRQFMALLLTAGGTAYQAAMASISSLFAWILDQIHSDRLRGIANILCKWSDATDMEVG